MARRADSLRQDVVGRPRALIAGVKVWSSGIVAKVFSPNGVHIGRKLALAGVAYRLYWTDYVAAEARKARRGMWRGTFVKPWQWRITAPPRRSQAQSRKNP